MTPITHVTCGQTAFYFDNPAPGEQLTAARVTLLDGSRPRPGTVLVCDSCGRILEGTGRNYLTYPTQPR